MKKLVPLVLGAAILFTIATGCKSSENKKEDTKPTTTQAETKEPTTYTEPVNAGDALSVADAKKFLDADRDGNKGKTVVVKAYPKGTTKEKNGEFWLYLTDKTGTGITGENFICIFKEEMREKIRSYKADVLVTVKGNISYGNNVIQLKDVMLAE
jgi:hypothetical protein